MIRKLTNEKKLIFLCIMSGFIVSLIFCNIKAYCDSVQNSIASKIVRLHIIADSDSDEDQKLKLFVRNRVIGAVPNAESKSESLDMISKNIENIRRTAQNAVYEKGFDYSVTAKLKKDFFPTRYYGTVTLPPGEYDTLEIKIGSGKGHNWWCVMYPPMCFAELDGQTPQEYEKQLSGVLSDDEYSLVAETDNPKIRVKFKIIEWVEENFRS